MNQVVVGLAVVLFANVILNNRKKSLKVKANSVGYHSEAIRKFATVT